MLNETFVCVGVCMYGVSVVGSFALLVCILSN